ncbi:hypothetical protein B0H13DRAFT_1851178 [Mycena leptocephala]|nr:hypothetical protein B0H13DRAFT_1851178 [Mycena leptocephala]
MYEDVDPSQLQESGCAEGEKERTGPDDPIEELEGLILAQDCNGFGQSGKVPWQLQDLSFAEKLLISQGRFRARENERNAIMFAAPIVKIYNILPPSQDDISEILAFIFVGPARSTDREYVRTPMLVRRQKIQDALDWLKLNYEDYVSLEISQENLMSLPESGIPCCVDWKQSEEADSNNIAAAMSSHDPGDGTENGSCSFSVLD